MNRSVIRTLLLVASSMPLLAACSGGGGGGGGSGGTPPTPKQMGGAIQGVPLAPTGATSTLAGSPVGSDGPRGQANYDRPAKVVSDGIYIYVADTYDHTIRFIRYDPDLGYVSSTLAGQAGVPGAADGTGSAARFLTPEGLALDGAGNLYVADTGNHVIRKIVLSTGAVTTFAGTSAVPGSADGAPGTGRLAGPRGLAFLAGVLYVADTGNCTIRAVSSAGVISTLAGSAGACTSGDGTGSAARFNYPYGIASMASSTTMSLSTGLFVADTFNHTIRLVTTGGVVTTELGAAGSPGFVNSSNGTVVRLDLPTDVAVDSTGSALYIADRWNQAIRRYTGPMGSTSTVAGDGSPGTVNRNGTTSTVARFRGPSGITWDAGYLWVTDSENFTVRGIDLATGNTTSLSNNPNSADGVGSNGRFYEPGQAATDGTSLYLAEPKNHLIRKVDLASGAVTTVAGQALVEGAADGVGTAATFRSPYGVTTDGTHLWVADTANHTIRRIVLSTGAVTTFAGTSGVPGSTDATGTAASFNTPNGITTDGTNLYVGDSGNHVIRQIVIATGVVTTLAGTAGVVGSADATGSAASFDGPNNLTTDGTNLYVADWSRNTIRKIVIATRAVTTLAGAAGMRGNTDAVGTAARFDTPYGISTDGKHLFVADWGSHTVRAIDVGTGTVTTLAGTAGADGSANGVGAAARFRYPFGVTNTAAKVYVTDSGNATVRAIQ